MRSLGWLLIAAGVTVALYLVYNLYWTGLTTSRAQAELLEEWEFNVGALEDVEDSVDLAALGEPREPGAAPSSPSTSSADDLELGEAVAAIEFVRPGDEDAPLVREPMLVVEGVSRESLQLGPGHYPGTSLPGQQGNFAVAGHRTTYGAPFFDLDQVVAGDEIHVTDRQGTRWIYEVVDQEVVLPQDVEVLRPDPLGLGRPMLTLTTCNPRFSDRERLIVWATLIDEQLDEAEGYEPSDDAEPAELVGEDV